MDEIVGRACVAKGIFYSHFDSKEAMAAQIAHDIREDVERLVAEANDEATDPTARIARAIFVYVERAQAEPLKARLMLKESIANLSDTALQRGVTADVKAGRDGGRPCQQRNAPPAGNRKLPSPSP